MPKRRRKAPPKRKFVSEKRPRAYALEIVSTQGVATRERYLLAVPDGLRPMVEKHFVLACAHDIASMRGRSRRREALSDVPDRFRPVVEQLVINAFEARRVTGRRR